MKKLFIVLLSVLLLAGFSSCNNNSYPTGLPPFVFVPGGSGDSPTTYNVSNYSALSNAIRNADDGDTIHFNDDFQVSPDVGTLDITKNLVFTGKIQIGTAQNAESNAGVSLYSGTTGFILFNVTNGTLTLTGLTVTVVDGDVSSVEAIISISNSGIVNISDDTVLPSNTTSISITASATNLNCISGTIQAGIKIDISADNSQIRANYRKASVTLILI